MQKEIEENNALGVKISSENRSDKNTLPKVAIPKTIHYIWFGGNKKNELIEKCIQSWKEKLPDYKIVEWNENNFDINSHPYMQKAYTEKKWAFVSDYARLKILYEHGGVYLDTDMYILKNFDDILRCSSECLVGKEDGNYINAAFMASSKGSKYLKDLLSEYDSMTQIETIPRVMTRLTKENTYTKTDLLVLPKNTFYPFDAENIKDFNYKNAPLESYGVHLWNYSWGHPLVKFVKRIGLHKFIIRILDMFKVKSILKKLMNSA